MKSLFKRNTMNQPVILTSLDKGQTDRLEEILDSDLTDKEKGFEIYTELKMWQNTTGQRLINSSYENCTQCDIRNMSFEWAKWYRNGGWPKSVKPKKRSLV